MTLGAALGPEQSAAAVPVNSMTPSADHPPADPPLSAYSRFAQRLRRRYAGELPLLSSAPPTRSSMAQAYEALRASCGLDVPSALRVLRQLVLERLVVLDCDQQAPLATVTTAVTELAEFTLDIACIQACHDLDLVHGAPTTAQGARAQLWVVGAQARALGGDLRLEGGTRPAAPGEPAMVQLRASGVVTADGLRQARELGFVSRLARDFTGSTAYQLALGFRGGPPEVLITSNLQGLALNLPAPLNKGAEALLPLKYENTFTREARAPAAAPAAPQRAQEVLNVDLGRVGVVTFVRQHVDGREPQVLRGAIAVGLGAGESVALPEEGVTANLKLGHFDVQAWEDALERLAGTATPSPTAAAPSASAPVSAAVTPAASSAAPPASPAPGYLPTVVALRARQLSFEGRTLHNVVVGGSRDDRVWRANVSADELNGYFEYRQPQDTGAGRLHARLARLSIAAAAASQVEALLEDQPGNIPALDIVVDDFELKGRKLGRLEIEAINRGTGTVVREGGIREWRLNKLQLRTPEAVFTASGNWAAVNAQAVPAGQPRRDPAPGERRRTAMKFELEIADAGGLLTRFGMRDVVRRGRGSMEGSVSWIGSPLAFDYPTLTGNFNVTVEAGQFLKADPGLAKLLGVLSLQSLPRRLALDFRDVFSQGFTFDFVRGDVTIEQGMAATNNLQMKGVNAAVLMDGKADIARETQDLKVMVVPEINAGTASLVATVINPAIGLGTFLAQWFLRQPLMRAATQEFHVTGTWSDPRVTRVPRSPPPQGTGQSASGDVPASLR